MRLERYSVSGMTVLTTVITTIKSKLSSAFSKVRTWMNPAYLKGKAAAKVKNAVESLLDVKPRDKDDYYPVLWWMVSKKLAYAVLILTMAGCVYCISGVLPENMGGEGLKFYKYDSVPLKFISGRVGILAADGHKAYVGDVDQGFVTGTGSLYDAQGRLVYEGEFEDNAYNGDGIRYYINGMTQYKGDFLDNCFCGSGVFYREDGTMEYEGEFLEDKKHGKGILYDENEHPVYNGTFRQDEILYQELLGKSTQEASQIYTGDIRVFETDGDYCVAMPQIDAVYCAVGGNTLDDEWNIKGIYVLRQDINIGGVRYTDIAGITADYGKPVYEGNTAVSLTDALAVNEACGRQEVLNGRVNVEGARIFDDVTEVTDYDGGYLVYLYVFRIEEKTLTFFTMEKNSGFAMYYIEAE